MNAPPTETNAKLGELMTEMVMDQVVRDIAREKEGPKQSSKASQLAGKEEEKQIEKDDDNELAALREKRIAALKKKRAESDALRAQGHGTYDNIKEDEFLPAVTKSHRAVVHFYHKDFERSKIFDKHLSNISKEHLSARFVKLDSEKAPFFTARLAIKTLPTIVLFIDGVAVHQIVGFSQLGCGDEFRTRRLASLIKKHKVITEALSDYGERIVQGESDYSE